MSSVLDIVALRSLTSVADCGGFRRAAEALHLSQSAVSQHVRRLEREVGRPLVQRDGRGTRFTHEGELLVGEARRILAAHDDALDRLQLSRSEGETFVVGSTEHAADELLPVIIGALQASFVDCSVRVRIDRRPQLVDRLDRGSIDLAVLLGGSDRDDAIPVGCLPLNWYSAPGWTPPPRGTALPLVLLDEPCIIRRRALQTLADSGQPATIVAEAGYLAGVITATRARLGTALLAHIGAAPRGLEQRDELPVIAPEPVHIRVGKSTSIAAAKTVAEALRTFLEP